MDSNLIVLIISVIVLALILYYAVVFFSSVNNLIDDKVSLNLNDYAANSSASTIDPAKIDMPTSSHYHYAVWIYINTNSPSHIKNRIFSRGLLTVNLTGSTLTVDNSVNTVMTANNVPFQKWVQIVVNVDGTQCDLYIDGKMVQSASGINIPVNANDPINYGNKNTVGSLTRFSRPAYNVSPQQVYNMYLAGSGQGSGTGEKYKLNLQLTRNKAIQIDKQIV